MFISGSSTPVLTAQPAIEGLKAPSATWVAPLAVLVVGAVLTAYLFRETLVSITTIWNGSVTYSYGFTILPICAFLAWRRRSELKNIRPAASPIGLCLFVFSALVWFAGNVADVQLVQQLAFVGMLDSLIWALLGTAVVRVLLFPLSFLFLAVPVGDSLVPLLQRWTAVFAVNALQLSGIPAVQDGVVISTPSGNWQVAESCSGIRYLIASIVMGILVAGVVHRSWKRRVTFLALSAALPVVANAIRAYGIVALGTISGNSIATGVDHVIYGFIFFSLLTGILLWVGLKWYEPADPPSPVQAAKDTPAVISPIRLITTLVLIVVICIGTREAADFLWTRAQDIYQVTPSLNPPAGWTQVESDLDQEWTPQLSAARSSNIKSFLSTAGLVSIYQGSYPDGHRGVELINSINVVGESHVWRVLHIADRQVVAGGRPVRITEYTISRGQHHRLVWLWYSTGGQLTSDPYRLRAIQAWNRLSGRPHSTSVFAASAPFHSDPSQATEPLSAFLK